MPVEGGVQQACGGQRHQRVLRGLMGGLVLVVAGVLGLVLVLDAHPDPATVPGWYLPVSLVWMGVVVLTAVVSTVVAVLGVPKMLMVPQVRGLSVDEADARVRGPMRLPPRWDAHLNGSRAPSAGTGRRARRER